MIGIIFVGEIYLCPFLQKYTDELTRQDVPYEIISWDRSGVVTENHDDRQHVFKKTSAKMVHPIFKLKDFFAFGHYCKRIIRQQKYDKLIVLTTLSGVFLYRTLVKHYKGRYIFDYRDASYEYLGFFKKMLGKLVKNSAFTCISSRGFLACLPKDYPYVMAHNFKYSDVDKQVGVYRKNNGTPLHISYIGVLRGSEYLVNLMRLFGNDPRFCLYIHGGGDNEEYLKQQAMQYSNVICTGRYEGDQKIILISESDILCYNYPCAYNNNMALANKYYDGLIFKRPLFANLQTHSGQLVDKMGVGISLDYDDPQTADKVYEYYQNLQEDRFLESASLALKEVLQEDQEYLEKIREFMAN